MPIWTDIPSNLFVTYPDELPLGDSFCQITVCQQADGNSPVEGALVCLMQGEDVYETGITGIDGQVDFDISTSNPSNDIQLTVTVQDFIPFESTISITSGMAYVQISSYSTNGSDEGYVIPGELDSMDIWLHNYGNLGATNISVLLTTDDSKITMIDSTELIGSIPAGDSIFVENAFSFQASDNLANEETVYLNSEITDDESNYWTTLISIIGATPVISYFYHNIIDSLGGDGDGIAEPGETVNPNIILKNEGLALAQNVDAILWCDNPYIEIPECIWEFGDILPSGFGQTLVEIGIDENCPAPSFPQIGILIMTEDGYQFSDSFLVIIGETGFQDDMEAGDENWTHYGTDDLWHLTSNRKFSGDYSWYCGNEGEFLYNDDIEEFLVSSPIILGQNAELSFWCWYKFPNYGTDGFYVEVNDGSGWTDLDFIGSGGALGILTIGNDWLEYKYDLSNYAPETELTLRFRFVSSSIIDGGEVAEGVYIDDVKIKEKSEIVFADFSADVTSGIMPLTVEFTDVSHSAVDSIVDWYWNFGDGETSTEQNPTHIYEIQGKKTVSLTVTDEFGFTTTKIKVDYIDVSTGGGYVIYVNPDGSGDYTNLHDGIEAVYDGDTLLVADAIYIGYENKNISFDGKSVIVVSENGAENCIIDCEDTGFAFILEHNDSLAAINGFTIRNTHTYGNGGAINCDNASAKIENCIFENCITDQSGGAVFGSSNSNLIISNCQFINCNALTGGGIHVSNYNEFVLENCTFDDNSADFAAGIKIISTLSSIVQNCNFNDGIAIYDGGAIYMTDCDSISLKDCEITNNSAQDGVGIYLITSNSIEMKNISITNNEASHYGGGIYTCEANTTMENCIISSNSANRGGGIYLTSSNAQFINCLVISNSAIGTASMGGGIYTNASNPDFINCTVANNSAVSYAGGIFVYSSDVNVVNSIFWGDTPQEIFPTTANLIAEYSDIQGGWTGDGNIDEDPLFVAGYPFDYHFTENSSCIDAGSNDYVWVDSDLDGNVRIWDGDGDEIAIVDMGCYEFGAPPVSVEPEPEPQTVITLYQNYPNPFSALTTISFNLATDLHGLSPLDSEHLTGQAQIRI
ncbi:MAG: right-handed parallel beta-helix repeat-containing protein, partial [Candidatus Cloacimonetes bacterium]|nr:right-handed parallel beta-helix repeat-containing protein [Candidatus Cloacimonadota bacterium]